MAILRGSPLTLYIPLEGAVGTVSAYLVDQGEVASTTASPSLVEGTSLFRLNLTGVEMDRSVVSGFVSDEGGEFTAFTVVPEELDPLGSGSVAWTYRVFLDSDGDGLPDVPNIPVPGCLVEVTNDIGGKVLMAYGFTGADGRITFRLDPGTYYLWRRLPGWRFVNPDVEEVS